MVWLVNSVYAVAVKGGLCVLACVIDICCMPTCVSRVRRPARKLRRRPRRVFDDQKGVTTRPRCRDCCWALMVLVVVSACVCVPGMRPLNSTLRALVAKSRTCLSASSRRRSPHSAALYAAGLASICAARFATDRGSFAMLACWRRSYARRCLPQ